MGIRSRLATAVLLTSLSTGALAQGIPVIDVANLIQTIQQVMNDITKIQNQVRQITQLREQLRNMSGSRNLGNVLNNPMLHDYVPAEAFTVLNGVNSNGYGGLSGTGKALRDANMLYNCLDRSGPSRSDCQAALALPYQNKGLLQDAMSTAARRMSQIQSLMNQINATSDQKAILELQARIGAENAMLSHEATQIQMLAGMADTEERISRARDRERQYEMLGRSGRIADYLR